MKWRGGAIRLCAICAGNLVGLPWKSYSSLQNGALGAGADPQGGDQGDRLPKTYESIFIHHNFVQLGKQHSRCKAILSPICFVTAVL